MRLAGEGDFSSWHARSNRSATLRIVCQLPDALASMLQRLAHAIHCLNVSPERKDTNFDRQDDIAFLTRLTLTLILD